MGAVLIEIDRLEIAVHGVSAAVVEEAISGLEGELRRRLGTLRGAVATHEVPVLRLGRLDLPRRVDAAGLRHLVAERLLEALIGGHSPPDGEGEH